MSTLKVNDLGKAYQVYGLFCPYTDIIMYVGVTTQPLHMRLSNHISESKGIRSVLGKWIRSLLSSGKRPVIRAVDFECEGDAIAHYGFDSLLNARRAGGGRARATPDWSPEIIARLGHEPDLVIAQEMNVSLDKVAKYRNKHGIEANKWRVLRERKEEKERLARASVNPETARKNRKPRGLGQLGTEGGER